ncbi:hypothetical protein PV413_23820 [Streptomyces scabiei]|uniref:hypothetical protein n=1 Tax=Streptomyces scabiei TaxID=1930 RepID=UPI0029B1FBDB|nr:hypothetical protein [Streptomyces scabiei]MDX2566059.1 hypothetical protein [Streptomyces scabiei]MDX3150457.1 hypothetical protein [Streptomyces scabiei]MDX3288099.1 hypothetical protein [Streptomyces scabiei]
MTRTAAAMNAMASAAPGPERPVYDRAAWERAVMASGMHTSARLIALILAHHAGDEGVIAAGGRQHARYLAEDSGIEPRYVQISLTRLERIHFITRPPIETWDETRGVRPVTLTVPRKFSQVPPSTGRPR